jgi:DNA-binding NarL/FixJ family response regulator
MIRIILAESNNIVRNGIKYLLEKESDIEIVGEAVNGEEVLNLLDKGIIPDIILADINMPVMGGIELTEKLAVISGMIKVILLTMYDDENCITKAFETGVMGYLYKNIGADELLFAIKHVYQNKQYISLELARRLIDRIVNVPYTIADGKTLDVDFTKREIEILTLIAEGYTNQEIADQLFTSKRTVEGHRQALIGKTGARNTPSLVRIALRNGIIS